MAPALKTLILTVACIGVVAAGPRGRSVGFDGRPSETENSLIMDALGAGYADEKPFTIGHADLNGDGVPDLLFRSDNPSQCTAQGCPTYAALSTEGGVGNAILLAISYGNVFVLSTKTRGMFDIRYAAGGPVFRWSGRDYR